MRLLLVALFLCFAGVAHAMSWPPGEGEAGGDHVSSEEMKFVWARWDSASEAMLGTSGDLDKIRQLKLPHGASLAETKWLSPRIAIAYAYASFDSGKTDVSYLVVFEKKWFRWKVRSYYTAIIACQG